MRLNILGSFWVRALKWSYSCHFTISFLPHKKMVRPSPKAHKSQLVASFNDLMSMPALQWSPWSPGSRARAQRGPALSKPTPEKRRKKKKKEKKKKRKNVEKTNGKDHIQRK